MATYDPRWSDAIASIESAGDGGYSALGPTTDSGDRAHGKYQVMGANIPEWSQAALGRSLTPQQFLADPSAQDAVFKHRFGGYADKYGSPQEAASRWFTGRSVTDGANASDSLGTTGSGYVAKFNRAMGAPDGPTAIQNAMRSPQGSPSMAMGFAPDNTGALSTPPPAPGVLSGTALDGYDWGGALQGAGAGLASIGSPAQGAALASLANASRKTAAATGSWSQSIDPTTGVGTLVNSLTGQTKTFQAHAAKPEKEDKVDPSILKNLAEDWTSKYGNLQYAAERAADFKKSIDNGDLDLGLAAKGSAAWESAFGKSSPATQRYNDFQAFRTQLANDSLRLNKGVQTEGDAERARQEMLTMTGAMDPKTASNALHNFIDRTGKVMSDGAQSQLDSYAGSYKNKDSFKPYYDRLEKQKQFYTDYAAAHAAAPDPAAASARTRPPLGSIFK